MTTFWIKFACVKVRVLAGGQQVNMWMMKLWLWAQLKEEFPVLMLSQPDGAPSHYHLDVRNFLDEQLIGSWIGRGGPTPWSPRSPDLSPLNFFFFFFWCFVKYYFYTPPVPQSCRPNL
jgi:hypothetical protein